MNKPSTSQNNATWTFLREEPLVHFLGLAVLLFVANAVFSGDQRDVITIDAATRDFIVQQRLDLMQRDLTRQEEQEAIEDYIEEEILVREARKRGFEDNSGIRKLLLQNMRFFLTSDIPEPTSDVLRQYFDENLENFSTRPTFTYEHVFFSDADAVPAGTLESLRGGTDFQKVGEGGMNIAKRYTTDEEQIVTAFGRDQGGQVLSIDNDHWQGPFISSAGAHFIRLVDSKPSIVPRFEAVEGWIRQDWLMRKGREAIELEVAEMREGYRVEIALPEQIEK